MTWARFDDEMLDNKKIAKVGPLGFALHAAGIIFCSRNLTDGFVPTGKVGSLLDWSAVFVPEGNPTGLPDGAEVGAPVPASGHAIARALVDAGLWERAEGGYLVHDYLHYNPSKAKVLEDREKARGRMRAKRRRSSGESGAHVGGSSLDVRTNIGRSSERPVPVPVPVPSSLRSENSSPSPDGEGARGRDGEERGTKSTTSGPTAPPGFLRLWALYPRKVGKASALKVWTRRRLEARVEEILAGLERVKAGWTERRFIPHPTTWLNRDGWEDEPEPPAAPPPPRITPARTQQLEQHFGRWQMSVLPEDHALSDDVLREARRLFPTDAPTAEVRAWHRARLNGVHA